MKFVRPLFSMTVLVLALLLAACGGSSSTTSSGSGYSTPSSSGGTTPTTVASAAGNALRTASVTLNGKTVIALTNSKGMTLYYFKPDTATTSACTDGCASTWPPYLASGSSAPTSTTSLPGKLTVQTNSNGSQVEYNQHFLYTYSGDNAPGQTNGEGIGGQWFVATTDLAASGGSEATPTSGSGYGQGGGY